MSDEKIVTLTNRRGLHARASAKFVRICEAYKEPISVTKGSNTVNGKSIMGLLMLGAAQGDKIIIKADANQASEILEKLTMLVSDKFGESE